MKKQFFLKYAVLALIFTVSFVGITVAKKQSGVYKKQSAFSLVTLGSKSMAYCNEATFKRDDGTVEQNDGCCNGQFNASTSRCEKGSVSPDQYTYECMSVD